MGEELPQRKKNHSSLFNFICTYQNFHDLLFCRLIRNSNKESYLFPVFISGLYDFYNYRYLVFISDSLVLMAPNWLMNLSIHTIDNLWLRKIFGPPGNLIKTPETNYSIFLSSLKLNNGE